MKWPRQTIQVHAEYFITSKQYRSLKRVNLRNGFFAIRIWIETTIYRSHAHVVSPDQTLTLLLTTTLHVLKRKFAVELALYLLRLSDIVVRIIASNRRF